MKFSDSTAAFFDELSRIKDEAVKEKEEGVDKRTDRPFSSMLTQDEEPTFMPDPASVETSLREPEIVTRGTG